MCGRYTLTTSVARLVDLFALANRPNLPPRYNIAPTQDVAAVRVEDGKRTLGLLRWGLVPPWAKDAKIGAPLINARAETLAEKPAFRAAFLLRQPAQKRAAWRDLLSVRAKFVELGLEQPG